MKKVIPLLLAIAGLANAFKIPADRGILHRAMNEDVWIDINVCSYNWNSDERKVRYNPISNEDVYGCMFTVNFWGATSDYVRIVEISYAQDANEYGADHHTEFLDLETYPLYHLSNVILHRWDPMWWNWTPDSEGRGPYEYRSMMELYGQKGINPEWFNHGRREMYFLYNHRNPEEDRLEVVNRDGTTDKTNHWTHSRITANTFRTTPMTIKYAIPVGPNEEYEIRTIRTTISYSGAWWWTCFDPSHVPGNYPNWDWYWRGR